MTSLEILTVTKNVINDYTEQISNKNKHFQDRYFPIPVIVKDDKPASKIIDIASLDFNFNDYIESFTFNDQNLKDLSKSQYDLTPYIECNETEKLWNNMLACKLTKNL